MRPRLLCRGNRMMMPALDPYGAGFNEAATTLSRKRLMARLARHSVIRFNEAATTLSRKRSGGGAGTTTQVMASMRPRLLCRGNGDSEWEGRVCRRASMRPRLLCRGNGLWAGDAD